MILLSQNSEPELNKLIFNTKQGCIMKGETEWKILLYKHLLNPNTSTWGKIATFFFLPPCS